MIKLSTNDFREKLKLDTIPPTENVSKATLAQLIREALARQSMIAKRKMLRYLYDILKISHPEPTQYEHAKKFAQQTLQYMVRIQEIQEVSLGGIHHIVAGFSRYMRLPNTSYAVWLGVQPCPLSLAFYDSQMIARCFQINTIEDEAKLIAAGGMEISLEDWIYPTAYQKDTARNGVKDSFCTLSQYWNVLLAKLDQEGLPKNDLSSISILNDSAGKFMGSYKELDARWSATAPEGVWCAYIKKRDELWSPCLVHIKAQAPHKVCELYDHDEWKWAMIARSHAHQAPEVIHRHENQISLTFRAPFLMSDYLDLWGPYQGSWSWTYPKDAPDLWEVFS